MAFLCKSQVSGALAARLFDVTTTRRLDYLSYRCYAYYMNVSFLKPGDIVSTAKLTGTYIHPAKTTVLYGRRLRHITINCGEYNEAVPLKDVVSVRRNGVSIFVRDGSSTYRRTKI